MRGAVAAEIDRAPPCERDQIARTARRAGLFAESPIGVAGHEKLGLAPDERHRVMRAAASAVEQDGRIQNWGQRLLEIQDSLQKIHAHMVASDPARGPRLARDDGAAEAADGA